MADLISIEALTVQELPNADPVADEDLLPVGQGPTSLRKATIGEVRAALLGGETNMASATSAAYAAADAANTAAADASTAAGQLNAALGQVQGATLTATNAANFAQSAGEDATVNADAAQQAADTAVSAAGSANTAAAGAVTAAGNANTAAANADQKAALADTKATLADTNAAAAATAATDASIAATNANDAASLVNTALSQVATATTNANTAATNANDKAALADNSAAAATTAAGNAQTATTAANTAADNAQAVADSLSTELDSKVAGPASAISDELVAFDGTTGKLVKSAGYNAAGMLDRANHTGTQAMSTVDGLNGVIQQISEYLTLGGGVTFANLSLFNVPVGINKISVAGHHTHGLGAADLHLYNPAIHDAFSVDPSGEGYWWTTSADGKKWFIPRDRGSPEMLGAAADNKGLNSQGAATDDWVEIQKAIDYFDYIDLKGQYWCTRTINVYRQVTIDGGVGAISGFYDGTVVFDRGLGAGFLFHRGDTFADEFGVPSSGANGFSGSQGSRISRVRMQFGNGSKINYDGNNGGNHGIWTKATIVIEDVRIEGPEGHGILVKATAASSDPYERGNANSTRVRNARVRNTTLAGIKFEGADANACTLDGCSVRESGGPAVHASEFLGNTYIDCQGSTAGAAGRAIYNGIIWFCLDPDLAPTTEPGTNSAVWYRTVATANPDTWPLNTEGGAAFDYGWVFYQDNQNASAVWINPYVEGVGGRAYFEDETVVIGNGNLEDHRIDGPCAILGVNLSLRHGSAGEGRVTTNKITASYPESNVYTGSLIHNRAAGAPSAARWAASEFAAGYEADDTTPRQMARLQVGGANGVDGNGRFLIRIYDAVADAYDANYFDFTRSYFRPNTDNVISLGGAGNRWSEVSAVTFNATNVNATTVTANQFVGGTVALANVTTAEKTSLPSPAPGTLVFDTDLGKMCVYNGTAWEAVTSS